MARALREVAADAEKAGLPPEEAVVGFLHLCREMHESLRQAASFCKDFVAPGGGTAVSTSVAW